MTAMRNASKNAGELIDRLTARHEPRRQAEITQEILEVVAGADALTWVGGLPPQRRAGLGPTSPGGFGASPGELRRPPPPERPARAGGAQAAAAVAESAQTSAKPS